MSMLPEQKLYFEEVATDIRSSSSTNSHDIRGWEAQIRYFPVATLHAYNARGYTPSDVPEDARYIWLEFAVDDVATLMRGFAIERAHVVGLSMADMRLQFGFRYPEKPARLSQQAWGLAPIPPSVTPG